MKENIPFKLYFLYKNKFSSHCTTQIMSKWLIVYISMKEFFKSLKYIEIMNFGIYPCDSDHSIFVEFVNFIVCMGCLCVEENAAKSEIPYAVITNHAGNEIGLHNLRCCALFS